MSTKEATKTEVKPAATLKEDVLALSKTIEKSMGIDKKTGIVTTETDIYEKTLPEGLTLDVVNAVESHNGKFIAASAHAIGNIAISAMKSNKDLETAETVVKMAGKNSLGLNVDRTRTYPNPQDKDKPIVKHGVVTVNYDIVADHNSGQLKAARSIIGDLAAAALK